MNAQTDDYAYDLCKTCILGYLYVKGLSESRDCA